MNEALLVNGGAFLVDKEMVGILETEDYFDYMWSVSATETSRKSESLGYI